LRTVALVLAALGLAVGLGAWAGTEVGVWAGVLASLAGLLPPAVLAVALERRQRNRAQLEEQKEFLRKHAPPKRAGGREGQK
jgi:Flp pilus assembly protein TadB